MHQADGVGLGAGEGQAPQDNLQGLGLAHHPRQALGPAAAGEDADPGLGQADGFGLGCGDAQVAGQGQLEAPALAEPVDGRHHRLVRRGDDVRQLQEARRGRRGVGARRRGRRAVLQPGAHVGQLVHVVVPDEDARDPARQDQAAHGGVVQGGLGLGVHLPGAGRRHGAPGRVGVGQHDRRPLAFTGDQAHQDLPVRLHPSATLDPTKARPPCALFPAP